LGPSEKGPTPSHELESSVGPRAIEVESTPIPLPTPDLDDGPRRTLVISLNGDLRMFDECPAQ